MTDMPNVSGLYEQFVALKMVLLIYENYGQSSGAGALLRSVEAGNTRVGWDIDDDGRHRKHTSGWR